LYLALLPPCAPPTLRNKTSQQGEKPVYARLNYPLYETKQEEEKRKPITKIIMNNNNYEKIITPIQL
jgi:hypothetical protein